MLTIAELHARQILDSRGNPTIEVDCVLDDGSFGRAAVPSGASTGRYEAVELRDGDATLFGGTSVLKAVKNVEVIAKALRGMHVADQRSIDQRLLDLDGTPNKSRLGANAVLGVSMAVCRARAQSERQPLWESLAEQYDVSLVQGVVMPVPLMNVLNGGKHADSGLSFQERMIVPADFPSFRDALRAGVEVFHALKSILSKKGHITAVGDEGGFAPRVKNGADAFALLAEAITAAGYDGKMYLAIDAAASELRTSDSGRPPSLKRRRTGRTSEYRYLVDGQEFASSELVDYYSDLCKKYPIVSIEDSHSEDDWLGFQSMQKTLGERVQLVGDDLFVTNTERIWQGIEKKAANAVLIKLNQIGTVSETVDAVLLAQKNGWNTIVSHRSGETEDTFISHFAVALKTGQIKTGAPSRGERTCKYNALLRIEEELGPRAVYQSPFAR